MSDENLTPGQQRVVWEAPLKTEIARLKRERDEAKEAAERYESMWREAEEIGAELTTQRDAALAQVAALRKALHRLRASARDYAWAEVERGELTIDMRLSLEAADEALAAGDDT